MKTPNHEAPELDITVGTASWPSDEVITKPKSGKPPRGEKV